MFELLALGFGQLIEVAEALLFVTGAEAEAPLSPILAVAAEPESPLVVSEEILKAFEALGIERQAVLEEPFVELLEVEGHAIPKGRAVLEGPAIPESPAILEGLAVPEGRAVLEGPAIPESPAILERPLAIRSGER